MDGRLKISLRFVSLLQFQINSFQVLKASNLDNSLYLYLNISRNIRFATLIPF